MYKFAILSLACLLAIAAEDVKAQIVRVGPGGGVRIRAPFVRVEVSPGGGTYVRAPFTSVETPDHGQPAPRYRYRAGRATSRGISDRLRPLTRDEISQSTARSPAEMSWRELQRHARAVANRLEDELRQVPDGAVLLANLRPGTIRDLLAVDSDRPPSQATADQLAAILESYDALAEGNSFPRITQLGGFGEVRQALVELTLPPIQRTRRTLSMHWTAFHRDLDRSESGATWQAYLEVPPELTEAHDNPSAASASRTTAPRELQQLEELLTRYEQAVGPVEYRAVAELSSFQATRRHLADYVDLLRDNAADPTSKVLRPESIPTPRPVR